MIASKTTTQVKGQDRVDRFLQIVRSHPNAHVTIGVHEGAGTYPGKDAPAVYEVALWNEFGTKDIPARSFVGSAMDDNAGKINQWREEMIDNIVNKNWTVPQALEAMGYRIQTLIENKIKSNVPPPDMAATVRAKQQQGSLPKTASKGTGSFDYFGKEQKTKVHGSEAVAALQEGGKTNTLRDTDLLLRSITYEVHI